MALYGWQMRTRGPRRQLETPVSHDDDRRRRRFCLEKIAEFLIWAPIELTTTRTGLGKEKKRLDKFRTQNEKRSFSVSLVSLVLLGSSLFYSVASASSSGVDDVL